MDWVLLIFVSVFVRILVAINRLNDFRLKARIAGNKKNNNRESIKANRNKVKIIRKKTWNGIVLQIVTFAVSFLCFSALILIEYWDNLT